MPVLVWRRGIIVVFTESLGRDDWLESGDAVPVYGLDEKRIEGRR